jgi:hypothetical protein
MTGLIAVVELTGAVRGICSIFGLELKSLDLGDIN